MNTIEQIRATLSMNIDDSAKLQFITLLVEQDRTNPQESFVYLIKNPDTGFIKIGFSSNPEKRLEQLKTGCPHAQLLTKFVGTCKDEGKLHKLFFERQIVREWFSLTDNDIIAIQDYFEGKEIRIERKPKEDAYQRALEIINKAGKKGIAESQVSKYCSALRKMSALEKKTLFNSMINSSDIKAIDNLGGGGNGSRGGRSGRRFFII